MLAKYCEEVFGDMLLREPLADIPVSYRLCPVNHVLVDR